MRFSTLLPIWLAAVATASPIHRRQSGMLSTLLNMLPSSYTAEPVSVKTLSPIYRSTATRRKTRYGPFKLPANKASTAVIEFQQILANTIVGRQLKADGGWPQPRRRRIDTARYRTSRGIPGYNCRNINTILPQTHGP